MLFHLNGMTEFSTLNDMNLVTLDMPTEARSCQRQEASVFQNRLQNALLEFLLHSSECLHRRRRRRCTFQLCNC